MTLPKKKKCIQCGKISEFIQCSKCETPQCYTCADVSVTELAALRKKNIKFECSACCTNEGRKSKEPTDKTLIDVVTAIQQQVTALQVTIQELKNNSMSAQTSQQSNCQSNDMDDVITEINERNKREKNVIIYDVKESESNDTNERKSHDDRKVKEMVTKLGLNPVSIKNIIRLGKLDSNSNRDRPMKVTLSTKGEAIAILKNSREKQIMAVKNDLTPLQRSKLKTLQSKMKEKQDNGDLGWSIKYMNGVPQLIKVNIGQKEPPKKTCLNDKIPDAVVGIDGYELLRSDRSNRKGGGACLYISNVDEDKIIYNQVTTPNGNDTEFLAVEITVGQENFILACVYRPPDTCVEDDQRIQSSLRQICSMGKQIIVFGDFNYPHIVWNFDEDVADASGPDCTFVDTLAECGLTQRSFTKIPPSIKNKPYEERLQIMKLSTHEKRRERGDLIETYKIMSNHYASIDPASMFTMNTNNLRGHPMKIYKERYNKEERKNFLSNRVFSRWNNLSCEVVTATSINQFKNRLDDNQ
ncbi:hypothetical protein WDU94_006591 [Cyamophila willieti]